MKKFALITLISLVLMAFAFKIVDYDGSAGRGQPDDFSGERALEDVAYQESLGPRTPGSPAHQQTIEWIVEELEGAGWDAEVRFETIEGREAKNIVARWGEGRPWVVIGAHYDSRLKADQDPDPDNHSLPVPGANDGASGVAVLLELARVLPSQFEELDDTGSGTAGAVPPASIWLVFFDIEDNGSIPGWDWILGSTAFVDGLDELPDAAVIVDMIGDADLNIYQERNSDPALTEEIWAHAAELGYDEQFIAEYKYSILDDHIPFRQAGVPAVDIIDFDYPYWHTLADTTDKVSAESLNAVGDTLAAWLTQNR